MTSSNESLISLVLVCALALAMAGCDTAAAPRPITPAAPGTARIDLDAKDRDVSAVLSEASQRPDGTEFKLADYAGKVIVVDFWATYCPPCRAQAPQLAKLAQKYRDQGLEVVGLSLNEKKDQTEVLDFVKQAGMTYTVGYAGDRLSAAFLSGTEDETGAPPIPQLFIFGKDGHLVKHLVGYNENHGFSFLDGLVAEQLSR